MINVANENDLSECLDKNMNGICTMNVKLLQNFEEGLILGIRKTIWKLGPNLKIQ